MDLKHLKAFIAVAEEQHFGRAAERLFISQPPLSQRIIGLEEELGVPLFVRSTRRVQLTAAGKVFLEHARTIVEATATAAQAAKLAETGQVGRVELGYIHSTSYTILPSLLRACRLKLPGIDIRLHEVTISNQLDYLLDGRVDVALARLPIEHPRVATQNLLDDKMVLAVPVGHPLLPRNGSIHVSRLADEKIIGYPPGGAGTLQDVVNRLFTHARVSPRFVHVAGTLHTALGLVSAAEGLAVVPESLMALRLDGVEYRRLTGTSAYAQLGFAWRTDRKSPAGSAVMRLAKDLRHSPKSTR